MPPLYTKKSENIYDCTTCPTRCDGISKEEYYFEKDTAFSEKFENEIIRFINHSTKYNAAKTEQAGYPDLEVCKKKKNIVEFFIEVKVQRRTFMSVKKFLPQSGLQPSETVALNLSDLLRYFDLASTKNLKIYILWTLLNRPCICGDNKHLFYYGSCDLLKKIYQREKNKRRFRRRSGEGDVVNGIHKGVTVNYHFSLNELKPWKMRNDKLIG